MLDVIITNHEVYEHLLATEADLVNGDTVLWDKFDAKFKKLTNNQFSVEKLIGEEIRSGDYDVEEYLSLQEYWDTHAVCLKIRILCLLKNALDKKLSKQCAFCWRTTDEYDHGSLYKVC